MSRSLKCRIGLFSHEYLGADKEAGVALPGVRGGVVSREEGLELWLLA
jgi:hypothetical protein